MRKYFDYAKSKSMVMSLHKMKNLFDLPLKISSVKNFIGLDLQPHLLISVE